MHGLIYYLSFDKLFAKLLNQTVNHINVQGSLQLCKNTEAKLLSLFKIQYARFCREILVQLPFCKPAVCSGFPHNTQSFASFGVFLATAPL